tara:strand:+ start:623 stop:742 length:120 start_codon:yes stop_codon:yes gene_type:complete
MALFAFFSVLTASAIGAYKLTPKPVSVSIKDKSDELIPW